MGQFQVCTEVWEILAYAFVLCEMATSIKLRIHRIPQTEFTFKYNPSISHRTSYF